MANSRLDPASGPASAAEVRAIFGDVDGSILRELMALDPTVADLEEASAFLAGDQDIFQPRPLGRVAGAIVDLLDDEADDRTDGEESGVEEA